MRNATHAVGEMFSCGRPEVTYALMLVLEVRRHFYESGNDTY